jgi:uncharacterized protein (DUF169 family)
MDIGFVREMGKGFFDLLRLRTMPLGINFFARGKDVPAEYTATKKRKVICNLIGFSRHFGVAVSTTREHSENLCAVADISLGFGKKPADFASKTAGAYARSADETAKMFEDMRSLGEGRCVAVGICPLDIIKIVPDVVQIWGTPVQMMELEYAYTWNHGDGRIELASNGHGGSCYEVLTWPILDGKIRMAVADMGDRRHGHAQDDEMILGVPIDMMDSLHDGLVHTMKTLNRLPILYNFDDIPFPIPPSVLEKSPDVISKMR